MAGRPSDDVAEAFAADTLRLTTLELALKYDRAVSTVGEWRKWCKYNGFKTGYGRVPGSLSDPYNKYMTFEGDAVVISDIEFPDHDVELMAMAMDVGRHLGIKRLIIAGDTFAMDTLSPWSPELPDRPTFVQSLKVGKRVLRTLLGVFDRIEIIMGNHDVRLNRVTNGELHLGMLLQELTPVQVSCYHFCYLDDILIAHPKNYSKIPLSVSRELADINRCRVIMGHTHHLCWGYSKGGYEVAESGCMRDPLRTEYKAMRKTRHPRWNPGFVFVLNGQIHLVPKDADLTYLLDPERHSALGDVKEEAKEEHG